VHRYLVTGTDTGVGKTRVTAALALALARAGLSPTIVKLVQTGLPPGTPGDAARAGLLAGVRFVELARFERAADPWSAALSADRPAVHASELVDAMASLHSAVVAEGAGGLMVPLNPNEHFGHVASLGRLECVVVVGLRLGCLNHALLTITQCRQMALPIAGVVLSECFGPTEPHYRNDVMRTLQGKADILGILPFAADEQASVEEGSRLFESLVKKQRK
jgi:dethiobiotin synthetase